MGRTRPALGALASIATLVLMGSVSALATPGSLEFGKCVAKVGGKFANAGCTKIKAGTEAYEWEPLTSGVKLVGRKETGTGKMVLEAADGNEISCSAVSQREGEFGPSSKEESNIVWVGTGCEALGGVCHSVGAKESIGEIVFNNLRAVPGIVKAEPKEGNDLVGLAFIPQSGTYLAEFSCAPIPVIVRGGVIVKMQADSTTATGGKLTNKMSNRFELEFLAEKPGKQVTEKFEGEPALTLEMNVATKGYEQTSLAMTLLQETSPKAAKVELRKCEANVC
jgi:hypothetical protein